ncbi:hypothetical protein MKX75_14055 [Paenibacillus sp. FSL R5-0341]
MHVEEHVKLWNLASIKIWDVRHVVVRAGEPIHAYRFPISGFIYTVRGNATITLDDTMYAIDQMQVLHGGKGVWMNISLNEDSFEFYLMFYRANLSLTNTRENQALLR